ncbi:MAG: hypothetical protein GY754_03125 [bacterium]|nr:hypothetical protein [bacterium]
MKPHKTNEQSFLSDKTIEIDNALESMDGLKDEALASIKLLYIVKSRGLQKEYNRLSNKLGPHHPRVEKIKTMIEYNEGLFRDLDFEIEKAKIEVPKFGEKSWMIHGQILDKDKKGIGSLTVELYNDKGSRIERLGFCATDERGYFHIINDEKNLVHEHISKSDKLFISVFDTNHKIVHKDTSPLYTHVGEADYREIKLSGPRSYYRSSQTGDPDSYPRPSKGRVRVQQSAGGCRRSKG